MKTRIREGFVAWFLNMNKEKSFKFEDNIEESHAVNESFKHIISLYGFYENLFQRLDEQIAMKLASGQKNIYLTERYNEVREANKEFYQAYLQTKDGSTILSTTIEMNEKEIYVAHVSKIPAHL